MRTKHFPALAVLGLCLLGAASFAAGSEIRCSDAPLLDATRALEGVDLGIAEGEIRALLGENGAGKSTLVRCLNRLDISLNDGEVNLQAIGLGLGYGFRPETLSDQLARLAGGHGPLFLFFADGTAYDLRWVVDDDAAGEEGLDEADGSEGGAAVASAAVEAAAAETGRGEELPPQGRLTAETLFVQFQDMGFNCGGPRGRIMPARALIADPELLLADEPSSGVDPDDVDAAILTSVVLAVVCADPNGFERW